MTKVGTIVLLLTTAAYADIVVSMKGTFEGVVSMPDSTTVSVVTPTNGTWVLPTEVVASVTFSDADRYSRFERPLLRMGVRVECTQPAATPTTPVQERALVHGSGIARSPTDQSTQFLAIQSEMRDPAMAGLLSALVPTLGHVYAGEPGTGIGFLAGEVALAIAAFVCYNAAATDTTETGNQFLLAGALLGTSAIVVRICECGNAVGAADSHNRNLREKLGLRLGLRLRSEQATFGVAYEF